MSKYAKGRNTLCKKNKIRLRKAALKFLSLCLKIWETIHRNIKEAYVNNEEVLLDGLLNKDTIISRI